MLNESLTARDLIVDSHWNIPLSDELFDNHTKENILKIAIGPGNSTEGCGWLRNRPGESSVKTFDLSDQKDRF